MQSSKLIYESGMNFFFNFLELWPKYSDISGFNDYKHISENRKLNV